MKKTRLFLLRHGETLSNIELIYQGQTGDSPLSELGIKEGEELGKALSTIEFSGIYSSPLQRSHETAKFIAKHQKVKEVVKVPGIIERDYGIFEGKRFDEIKAEMPELYDKWLHHPHEAAIPGAETLDDLQARGVKAVEEILSRHKGENICIVGHGALNRTILFHYMNLTLDNFWRIKQDNCCVNIIEFDRHPMVILLNSTWFLGEKRLSGISAY